MIIISFIVLAITACGGQGTSDSMENQTEMEIPGPDSTDYDPYFVESTTIVSSLGPKAISRNLLQAQNGDIWMATWEGIFNYDGQVFTNWTNKERLRRYHAFSLLEDQSGHLWFGTIGAGVYRYDGRSFVNISQEDGLAYDRTGCFYEDRQGNIWIGTEKGISVYSHGDIKNYFIEEEGVSNDVNAIVQDNQGIFWIGTRGYMHRFDGNEFIIIENEDGQSFQNVRTMIRDRFGNIWFGGNDGLWSYNGEKYRNHSPNFVGYIYEDRDGLLWTSSIGADSRNWILSRLETDKTGSIISSEKVKNQIGQLFGILQDTQGNLWVGHERGVFRYDGQGFNNFSE